ncbi:autotransporter outer membrane beta-barrel domain-containing protein [Microvirga lenta]|uniref:autotransporter outer membrane beta-barrel domain-containing protein n=1 Tax=Microvirga lenta TaxID=2881337 RepID=UPI001CFFD67C|nr:autotransporter domain-containing protein [Microvirga lenta]MCB5175930.1 autotransporter domain-containing protein [Microvirga lenta]
MIHSLHSRRQDFLGSTAIVTTLPLFRALPVALIASGLALAAPAQAADVIITAPGTTIIAPGQSVEFQAENGATSGSIAQVNGGVVIGSVTATAAGVGVLNFVGDGAGVDGNVSNTFRVTIGGTGSMAISGTVTDTGAFYSQAATLTIGGDFQNSYVNFTSNRDGTLILNGANNSISTVLTTGSTGILGTITLGTGSSTTFTGAVGGTARIKQLNLNGTLATFNGNVAAAAVNFGADGIASIRGSTFNASVTTSTDGAGTLSFQPNAQTTVNGTIGSASHGLKQIQMNSGTGSIVRLTQAAYADQIAINGLGTLILDPASRLDTSAGSANAATGTAVSFGADGLLSISSPDVRIGKITTSGGTAGQGRVAFSGSGSYLLGAGIGTEADRLRQISISNAGATVSTAPFSSNYVSSVRFSADGAFHLTEGASLTGDVTTATNGRGTLVFDGGNGATIKGDVGSGAAQIKELRFGASGNGTIDGSIYAQTTSFASDPSRELTISGNIFGEVQGAPGGGGKLTFSGNTSTGGDIGSLSPLGSVAFSGTGVSTLRHDINASAATGSGVLIANPGTTLRVGATGKTITGALNNLGTLDVGANTLNVNGNVSFGSGSTYGVRTTAAGASGRVAATGAATLSGGTVDVLAEDATYLPGLTYSILTAHGGVSGEFTDVRSNFAFLTPSLSYDANKVNLTLVRKTEPQPPTPDTPQPPTPDTPQPPTPDTPQPPTPDTPQPPTPDTPQPQPLEPKPVSFDSVAVSSNQASAAKAVEALGSGSPLFNAVIGQSLAGARQAFDALSGEAHATAPATAVVGAGLVQTTVISRLRNAPTPSFAQVQGTYSAAYAADAPGVVPEPVTITVPTFDPRRFALWGQGFGTWGTVKASPNLAGLDTSTGGFILGAEARIDQTYTLGIAGGFTRTTFEADARLSSGTTDTFFASVYGSAAWGNLNVRLGTSYAWHDIDAKRSIRFPGFADEAHASYGGSTIQAFGEVGYVFNLGPTKLEPFVGASVLRVSTDGFQEEGGPAALTGYAQNQDLATTTFGLRAEARLSNELPLTAHGMLGWRRAYGDINPTALMAFSGGASSFTVAGTPVDRDALVGEAGLDWQAGRDISLGISYEGQIGSRAQEHTLKGSFVWRFGTR